MAREWLYLVQSIAAEVIKYGKSATEIGAHKEIKRYSVPWPDPIVLRGPIELPLGVETAIKQRIRGAGYAIRTKSGEYARLHPRVLEIFDEIVRCFQVTRTRQERLDNLLATLAPVEQPKLELSTAPMLTVLEPVTVVSAMPAIITRQLGNVLVGMRHKDGYFNGTAMCQASMKRWHDYRRSQRTQQFLEVLSLKTGIPVFQLIQSVIGNGQGLVPEEKGTWIHPRVAINLAQWCSAEYDVEVSGWVLDWYCSGINPLAKRLREKQLTLTKDLSRVLEELIQSIEADEQQQITGF